MVNIIFKMLPRSWVEITSKSWMCVGEYDHLSMKNWAVVHQRDLSRALARERVCVYVWCCQREGRAARYPVAVPSAVSRCSVS